MRTRKRLRRDHIDYTSGSFFVTIVTHKRMEVLGTLDSGGVVLSSVGALVREAWHTTVELRPDTQTEAFVIMPDHIHAVLTLNAATSGLGVILRGFKSRATRRARAAEATAPPLQLWQRAYHARRLMSEGALRRAVAYTNDNPARALRKR